MHGIRLYFRYFCVRCFWTYTNIRYFNNFLPTNSSAIQIEACNVGFVNFQKSNVINKIDHRDLLDGTPVSYYSRFLYFTFNIQHNIFHIFCQIINKKIMIRWNELPSYLWQFDRCLFCLNSFMVILKMQASRSVSFLFVDLCI